MIEMLRPNAAKPYKFRCERGCRGEVRQKSMTMRDAREWYRRR